VRRRALPRSLLLPGDSATTATAAAGSRGLDEVFAGVPPDGKAEHIERTQAET